MTSGTALPDEPPEMETIAIDGVPVPLEHLQVLTVDLIKDLDLSVRTRNVLKNAEIRYLGDLLKWDESSLSRLPNCGRKTIDELRGMAGAYGLTLGKKLSGWFQPTEPGPTPPPSLADLDDATRTRLMLRLDELTMSARATNVLKKAGAEFVGDVVHFTSVQLLRVQNCGRVSVVEIKFVLGQLGLRLGMTIADWDQKAARETRRALDRQKDSVLEVTRRQLANAASGACLEEELDGILRAAMELKSDVAERNIELTKKNLGWTGKGQRTLESVGQEYSLTRERVRQITAKAIRKIRRGVFDTPWLDKAVDTATKQAPATAAMIASALQSEGITKVAFDPTGLASACECLGKDFGLVSVNFRDALFYVRPKNANILSSFFNLCRRQTSSHGCVNFEAVCDELRIAESERDSFRAVATTGNICEWLDDERRWLFVPGVRRNRIINLVSKILSVSPDIRTSDLRRALSRSRRLPVVPPVVILSKFLERFGLATVAEDRISASRKFHGAIEAGSNEEIVVEIFRRHGPVLSWDRFREYGVAAGMNPVSCIIVLSNSPIVARLARGIYSLVGSDVPPGLVEEIANDMGAARAPFEWGWTKSGRLWCAIKPISTALSVGSATIPKFVGDLTGGEWKVRSGNQVTADAVKCSGSFLSGLRKHLVNAGAEPDDVCILEFDLSARTVGLTIGGEELIDLWDDGTIELDFPGMSDADSSADI